MVSVLSKPYSVDEWGVADIALAAHVPFAEMAGGVPRFVQGVGDRRCGRIEPIRHAAFMVEGPLFKIRRDLPPLGVLTGKKGRA